MDPRQVLKTEVTCVWKWLKCPSTEEWIKKMWYRYIMEYYSAIKKEWNNAFCSSMERPRQCHTEWSKSDREGEISYDIPYMWNLKRNDTNEFTKQKETHTEQTYSCQGKKRGVWDGQVKPLRTCYHREFCSVLCGSLDGRAVWGRMDMCVYIWLSPFTIHLKRPQHG